MGAVKAGGLRLCGCSCSRLLTRQRQYKRELEDTTKYGDSAEYSAAAIHLERFGLHYLLVHEGELSRIRGRSGEEERGHRRNVVTSRRGEQGHYSQRRENGQPRWAHLVAQGLGARAPARFQEPQERAEGPNALGPAHPAELPRRWRDGNEGLIYDPNHGWSIKGKLQLNDKGDKLKVKGWMGIGPLKVSRSYTWSKIT